MTRRGVLALALAACLGCSGERGVHVVPRAELPADVYAPASPASSPFSPHETFVWFVRGPFLEPVRRIEPGSQMLAEVALRDLLAGPNPDELASGITTTVPGGTELLGVALRDEVVIVNLSKEFELGAAQEVLRTRLGQVVYTLTELPRIRRVEFLIDGESVDVVDDSGTLLRRAVGRDDYASLRPQAAESAAPATGAAAAVPDPVASATGAP